MKQYLAFFASKNFEFRLPELNSIAKLFGIPLSHEEKTTAQIIDVCFYSKNNKLK